MSPCVCCPRLHTLVPTKWSHTCSQLRRGPRDLANRLLVVKWGAADALQFRLNFFPFLEHAAQFARLLSCVKIITEAIIEVLAHLRDGGRSRRSDLAR